MQAICLGNSHRFYAPLSLNTYNALFDDVYIDHWGPAPHTSSSGFSYYIALIDAHTKYTSIFFLKNNS